ncbi:MAG: hypothetical protein Q7T61_02220 [Caulobacter sp.]|nr:hypothetical protein [Caulobacter sp.]
MTSDFQHQDPSLHDAVRPAAQPQHGQKFAKTPPPREDDKPVPRRPPAH